MASSKPNIIVINCDDLGYGDLGCYGSTVNDTPHLDRLAAEGRRFTDFYMASPVCSPSRGAMLTGCYPPRIGFANFGKHWVLFPGMAEGLNPDETTFARQLQDQGYETQLVGKWHCGDQPAFMPNRHGFDHFYGLPYSNDMGKHRTRQDYPPLPLMRDEDIIQEQPDQASLTERYVEEAVRFLREPKDKPFLLYFAHMYVHVPLYTPDCFNKRSRNGRYGAAVACIDWATGVIMAELKRLGIDENTLVLFTSDNGSSTLGGGSNGPLRGRKGTTWDGGMRLPLIARWPGKIPAGTVCDQLCSSIDFLPTFASLAGARVSEKHRIDGKDISSLLCDEAPDKSPREYFFYYFRDQLDAVRDERWKLFVGKDRLIRGHGEQVQPQLYDLRADMGETTDVAADHPDVVARLSAVLDEMRTELGDDLTDQVGTGCRPCGVVDEPKTLTEYNEDHPYIVAMYDMDEVS